MARDGYVCQMVREDGSLCGARATDVDHVDGHDDHRLENLQALCGPCHRTKTAREANAAKPKRKREREQHPGLRRPGESG